MMSFSFAICAGFVVVIADFIDLPPRLLADISISVTNVMRPAILISNPGWCLDWDDQTVKQEINARSGAYCACPMPKFETVL